MFLLTGTCTQYLEKSISAYFLLSGTKDLNPRTRVVVYDRKKGVVIKDGIIIDTYIPFSH